MYSVIHDLRYAARRLIRDRTFSVTALATLGACLAANTFVFTIVYSVLLSPLPVPESDRIVTMYNSYPNVGAVRAASGVTDYYDRLEALDDLLVEQAAYRSRGVTLGDPAPPQRLSAMEVTPSFFRLLRSTPQLGRIFEQAEGEPGNSDKVILSDGLWRQSFGGRPDIVGDRIFLDGAPHTVVGVMAADFLFVDPDIRLWTSLAFPFEERGDDRRHSNNNWENVGRLRPSATLAQVAARLESLTAANHERFPQFREALVDAGYHVKALLLKDELVRQVRPTLLLLWGGVLLVLAIGLANLANLVLARTTAQARELGTRFALGASVAQVARTQLNESVLLGTAGGAVGVLGGWLGLLATSTLGIDRLPRGAEIALTPAAAVAVVGLGLLSGLLLGLIPVLQTANMNLSGVFADQRRQSTAGKGPRRFRNALVIAQVGIAFTLLLGAGLLLASFREVLQVDPGFQQPESLLTARISPPETRYPDRTAIGSFHRQLLSRIRALPGVQKAALTTSVPFADYWSDSVVVPVGYQLQPGESVISPSQVVVTPDYFEAMGIPLLAGRLLDSTDTADTRRSVVIDERLARHFWKGESPLGRELFFPDSPEDLVNPREDSLRLRVVGVVGSIRERALVGGDERFGTVYQALEQQPRRGVTIVVRSAADPGPLLNPLRNVVGQLDPELPVFDAMVLSERIDRSLLTHRTPMLLAVAFGVLALFLSAIGIYGVLGYVVAQRTNEIGIRMALGGDRLSIFRLVFGRGLVLLGAGLAVGVAGVIGLSRLIAVFLYGIRPLEPGVVVAVALLLALVAATACLGPARRATRVDPVRALNR